MVILRLFLFLAVANSFSFPLWKLSHKKIILSSTDTTNDFDYSSGLNCLIEYLNNEKATDLMTALAFTDKKLSDEARLVRAFFIF